MTKWVKRAAVLFSLLFLVILIVGGKKVLDVLPSQQKVADALQSAKSSKPKGSLLSEKSSGSNTDSGLPEDASPQNRNEIATTSTSTERKESTADLLAVVEEDPRDIRVCENLGQSRFKNDDALGSNLQFDALFQDQRKDSVIEAIRFPVRAIFQDPSVVSLLRELDGLEKNGVTQKPSQEKESTLEKIGFYGRVMKAGSQLYLNKRHFETIGDRAVHLRTIAKLAMMSPELASDAQLMDFCREVENAGTAQVSESAISAERAKLMSLIQSKGFTPEQLGFDPSEHVKFTVQASKTGFSFSLSDKTAAE